MKNLRVDSARFFFVYFVRKPAQMALSLEDVKIEET